ncbi:MAG TPA: hypothetical protein VJV03_18420 [Pyrinomonadaceae bacterium]|nr:hypothetical protein [Pyrinomonadaceae bacterium]
MLLKIKVRLAIPAALVILSAAVFGAAQEANKHNTRPEAPKAATAEPTGVDLVGDGTTYSYEFKQPEFFIKHILIEHDSLGRGRIKFVHRTDEMEVEEPLQLSPEAISRITGLWRALNFLDSTEGYQAERQFPHLGTMRLKMEKQTRQRTAELNWTHHPQALALVNEYRRVGDQAILVFDLSVARESIPLNTPKLMERLEALLKRNGLSDAHQLLPLLKEVSTDDHLPLIARNHALRLIKKIEK